MYKFHTVLARDINKSIRDGEFATKGEAAEFLGYKNTGSMNHLLVEEGSRPSREVFAAICKKWPHHSKAFKPEDLRPMSATGSHQNRKKGSLIEEASGAPKVQKCAYVSIFEASRMLGALKDKALIAEVLENLLIHHKIPVTEVIGALKAGE